MNYQLRGRGVMAPDWAAIFNQLLEKGVDRKLIAESMGLSLLSDRMLLSYRSGLEPSHARGERLIELWCSTMKKKREKLPMKE